jgi:hypothetical protein
MTYTFIGNVRGILTFRTRHEAKCEKFLTKRQRGINYRLCRAGRYIESAFGILTNKWRIFHRPLSVKMDHVLDVIKFCCILHNFVDDRDGYRHADTMDIHVLEYLSPAPAVLTATANHPQLSIEVGRGIGSILFE